jgi:hypothetical protein
MMKGHNMRRNSFVLCLACLVLIGAMSLPTSAKPAAATYYVDRGHPQASDSNPGTEALPWLTIQHAAQVAVAGDTIIVKAGVYPERVTPPHSGLAGQLITFKASPRRSVTMWGFYTVNANYLRIEGFNITTDASLTGWTDLYGVFVHSDHVEVVDNYFYNLHSTAIQGYWHEPFPQAAYIADNTIYHSQMGLGITGADWIVERNEVDRLFQYGSGDCDYSRFFGDNHIIRYNFFHGTNFSEIGSAHVDCFQTFTNNGEHAYNILFEGNTCYDFHQALMAENIMGTPTSHFTFRNNLFAHGGAWGLCVYDIPNITVENNTFADIQYHGAGFQGSSTGNIVRNNIFYDTGTSYWTANGGQLTGDYNLIFAAQNPSVSGAHNLLNVDPLFVDFSHNDYRLRSTSPAIDNGLSLAQVSVDHDRISRPQGSGWDIGAFEFQPALKLNGAPANQAIYLSWSANVTLPLTNTWRIAYYSQTVPIAINNIVSPTRAYTLTGLTNYVWYTVTLNAMLDTTPFLTDTIELMPTDRFVYLPMVLK